MSFLIYVFGSWLSLIALSIGVSDFFPLSCCLLFDFYAIWIFKGLGRFSFLVYGDWILIWGWEPYATIPRILKNFRTLLIICLWRLRLSFTIVFALFHTFIFVSRSDGEQLLFSSRPPLVVERWNVIGAISCLARAIIHIDINISDDDVSM